MGPGARSVNAMGVEGANPKEMKFEAMYDEEVNVREVIEIVYGSKQHVQLVDRRKDRRTRFFPPSDSRHCQLGSCKTRQSEEN
uniref:Uncharacterized protein n=1 Tax=Solanum tuberosum TaxID=4113 RepID=M1DC76_SOLTU